MSKTIQSLVEKNYPTKEDLVTLLNTSKQEAALLFKKAHEVRVRYLGADTFLRGLIEVSNKCHKNCLYCGIRKDACEPFRYTMTLDEIRFSLQELRKNKLNTLVLQSGEATGPSFSSYMNQILDLIEDTIPTDPGITISSGEQTDEVYQQWFNRGARRYLLRMESFNKELFSKIHPDDNNHNFSKRLSCLKSLQKIGYKTGTGVMVGLPGQTVSDLADDLIHMQELNIKMCGMGPYIEAPGTPMFKEGIRQEELDERLFMTHKMVAILRIMMKDINIAATTAMQTISNQGICKGLHSGANVAMINLTPRRYRSSYNIYSRKALTDSCNSLSSFIEETAIDQNEIVFNKSGITTRNSSIQRQSMIRSQRRSSAKANSRFWKN